MAKGALAGLSTKEELVPKSKVLKLEAKVRKKLTSHAPLRGLGDFQ